jgi:hypothetical protein
MAIVSRFSQIAVLTLLLLDQKVYSVIYANALIKFDYFNFSVFKSIDNAYCVKNKAANK